MFFVSARIVVKHTTEKATYFFGWAERQYPQRRLFIDDYGDPLLQTGVQRAATHC